MRVVSRSRREEKSPEALINKLDISEEKKTLKEKKSL